MALQSRVHDSFITEICFAYSGPALQSASECDQNITYHPTRASPNGITHQP